MSDCSRLFWLIFLPKDYKNTFLPSPAAAGIIKYFIFHQPNRWKADSHFDFCAESFHFLQFFTSSKFLVKYASIPWIEETCSSTENHPRSQDAVCRSMINHLWVHENFGLCCWIRVRTSGKDSVSDWRTLTAVSLSWIIPKRTCWIDWASFVCSETDCLTRVFPNSIVVCWEERRF
jgi:hypothetical protein